MDDRALTIWVCEQLGEIDEWVWWETADQAYPPDKVGVNYGRIPASAERAVGARVYGGTDDDVQDTKTRRLQLRFRGARGRVDNADELADQAFDRLRTLFREGVISEVTRTSFAPAGSDGNQREERTDNYLINFDNEEAPS